MKKVRFAVCACMIVSASIWIGCSSKNPAGTTDNNSDSGASVGAIAMKVDGVAWQSLAAASGWSLTDVATVPVLTMFGVNGQEVFTIILEADNADRPEARSYTTISVQDNIGVTFKDAAGNIAVIDAGLGPGVLTITEVDESNGTISGTFQFYMKNISDDTPLLISGGSFNKMKRNVF